MASRSIPFVRILVGPTASGKSALALKWAQETGAWIVNADAVQVYKDLRLLSARPSVQEEQQAPHRLYGHQEASQLYSVASWIEDAIAVLAQARNENAPLIFVGGTGLYIKSLLEGLSPLPSVPDALREEATHLMTTQGLQALYEDLRRHTPEDADRLMPQDQQRVMRAWCVWRATGKSLKSFQDKRTPSALACENVDLYRLHLDRDLLKERAETRLRHMFDQGALEEVRALEKVKIHAFSTLNKALGVPPLQAHLRGEITQEEAFLKALQDTFHYIKRQETFFRHQFKDFQKITPL